MFDFLRNLTKSAEAKHQERIHAYLDDALTPQQRQQFEQELAQDGRLRTEIDNLRLLKQQLRQLPRRPLPRNFTLDAALYGRPARQPLFQLYPVLQGATVLTALFFILALFLNLFQPQAASAPVASAPQATMAVMREAETAVEGEAAELFAEDSAANEAADESIVVPQVVTEVVVEQAAEESMEEEMMEEAPAGAETGAAVADEPLPQPTTVPPVAAPFETATAEAAATSATPLPTATTSEIPRPSAAQTAVPRLQSQDTEALDGSQESTADTTASNVVEPRSTLTPTPVPPAPRPLTISPLRLAQIGLGLLLIIFGGLTYFVRRRL